MGRNRRNRPQIFHIVGVSALCGLSYSGIVLVAVHWPESLLGKVVHAWIEFTRRLVEAILFLAPPPGAPSDAALVERTTAYRHLLVACSLLAIWSVLASRPLWPYWADHLRRKLGAGGPGRSDKLMLVSAYRTTILGIVAVAFLVLFGEPNGLRATTLLYANDWTLLRAPLLPSIACALGCRAGALWYWLTYD